MNGFELFCAIVSVGCAILGWFQYKWFSSMRNENVN